MEDIIAHLKGLQPVEQSITQRAAQHSGLHVVLTALEEVLAFSRDKPCSEVYLHVTPNYIIIVCFCFDLVVDTCT